MNKVRKLKKRSLYVLGLIFTLVMSYVVREDSASESQSLVGKVPSAKADIPYYYSGGGDTGYGGDSAGHADSADVYGGAGGPGGYSSDDSDGSSSGGGDGDGCFVAGTKITLFDGSLINIEDVVVGDDLLGSNGVNKVVELKSFVAEGKVYAINGSEYFVTPGHPFMTESGWKAFDVETALRLNPDLQINQLSVGDVLVRNGESVEIKEISFIETSVKVFNFEVSGTRDYYADGYLVHNK